MKYTGNVAILVLALCITIMLASSFFITQLQILDTDPSTYVIVPILMLPLLCLFMVKEKLTPSPDRKSLKIGIALFALFILLFLYLRLSLSFWFISYRIDMLLFPIAIASLAMMLFGIVNLRRFAVLIIYPVLASPLLFAPIINAYNGFSAVNTEIVYSLIKPFVSTVSYAPPITLSTPAYAIGIGETCVSIGAFLAIAAFLIPMAYLFRGTLKRKLLWIVSGVLLLLLFNILRMLFIAYYWLANGPNSTLLVIHLFIGQILFYLAIAIMIIVAGKYGLEIEKLKTKNRKKAASGINFTKSMYALVSAAFAFSIVYFLLTLSYSSADNISPIYLYNYAQLNFSKFSQQNSAFGLVNTSGFNSTAAIANNGASAVLFLANASVNSSEPIEVLMSSKGNILSKVLNGSDEVKGTLSFFDSKGFTSQVMDIYSNGTEFIVYSIGAPVLLQNTTYSVVGITVLIPDAYVGNGQCSSYDGFYTSISNIFNPSNYNSTENRKIIAGYCIAEKLVNV